MQLVMFSPDGKQVVSGSYDGSVRIWDATTGMELKVLNGHSGWVHSVAYSPDGTHIVSASFDNSIRIWDALTGEQLQILKGQGHTNWVHSVAYSPDGTHIVSASNDKTVCISSPFEPPTYLCEKDGDRQHTGWLTSPSDPTAYLMFVPLIEKLPDSTRHNLLTIPTSLRSYVDFSNAKLGERWTEIYVSHE